MIEATVRLAKRVGVRPACAALGVAPSTYYRRARPRFLHPRPPRQPPLKLKPAEVTQVLEELHSPRFVDRSPRQIWATLLDEDQRYLCSVRTMYRLLESRGELRERRDQLRHPEYAKPELLATRPNEVWSWDITKLRGPRKGTWYHLYVILDIFSRCVVGWLLASREEARLAEQLIEASLEKQGIERDQLILHADRGSSMKSKSVALLLSDLGVGKSHSRPYTSNDNPFSEAQFKTVKYHPSYPDRFGSLEDARGHFDLFFRWYNHEHRHTQLALLTPSDVHYGRAEAILSHRSAVLTDAFSKHPERFKGRVPQPGTVPEKVWINPPAPPSAEAAPVPETPGPEPSESPAETSDSDPRISSDLATGASPSTELASPRCLLSSVGWGERRILFPEPAGGVRPADPPDAPQVLELQPDP